MDSSCGLWFLSVYPGRLAVWNKENPSHQQLLEPTNHINDCYFCMFDTSLYKRPMIRRNSKLNYPSIPSCIFLLPQREELPILVCPTLQSTSDVTVSNDYEDCNTQNTGYLQHETHFPDQQGLHDLVRDFNFTNAGSELLASTLKSWNLLATDVKILKYQV